MKKTTRVFLLLGTNLGNREVNLKTAISLLVTEMASYLYSGITESSVYETEPVGFISDDKFLNQVISFETTLGPMDVLRVCKYVEKRMGRPVSEPLFDSKGSRIYHSRIIDIDILLYGSERINLPDLVIPHPRLIERQFAQLPLKEILSGDFLDFFEGLKQ